MKKKGILNRELAGIFGKLGHTDQIVIADCGLPVPEGTKCIDLSYKIGEPGFLPVVEAVLEDLEVEQAVIAEEMEENNQSLHTWINKRFKDIQVVSHEDFKERTKSAKVIIRTGEATPYANIILQSGVIF